MGDMKNYVLGFAFDRSEELVLLLHKTHPDWQRGCLNGLGGHIEGTETPAEAMVREFKEECGISTSPGQWTCFTNMHGYDWQCAVFATQTNLQLAKTITDEEVEIVPVNKLPGKVISNLTWLIPLALDAIHKHISVTAMYF